MVTGKVLQRTIGPDGQVTGTYVNNPYLNSIIYDVEFRDGQVKEYAANIIASMSTTIIEAIVDHRRDDEKAHQQHDKYVQTKNGRRHLRKTTKGWELLIKWKDNSESWIKLADMKESHPVEVAEYARARGIDKEPSFKWWAPDTLKKRHIILAALKKRIWNTTHKYGIEIPMSVEHAFELDRNNWCQKRYIICGPEFGMENVGKVAIMHRAVYGGKMSRRDFRNHLRSCIHFINFTSCPVDPDVWMRPAIKSDGTKSYDYVMLYVDDALVVSENAESILRNEFGSYFELNEESIRHPDHYLGGKVRKVQLENGVIVWAFSSSQYVQTAVKNVEAYLKSEDSKHWKMPNKTDTPLTTTYRPELDVSREVNVADAAYYQSLIGILRWIVELG